ncbi:MAG: winged helix-turn-helix transcriptional regulator [Acidimicrobiia bacterium]|nr:winged helix-turn-helix transcriptional regulator [Acidimicrobiia bacterium]
MPKKRPYEQYCPIAQTLDVVGDRWSLLIARELFLGPARYGELAQALKPISTDVLAKRLRELESTAIIDRADDGSYVLTEDGRGLAPVLQALGRWGRRRLGLPTAPAERDAATALQMLVIASIGTDLGAARTIEVHAGDLVCTITSGTHGLTAQRRARVEADVVVATDGATLWAVGLGQLTLAKAVASGAMRVEGDAAAVEHLFAGGVASSRLAAQQGRAVGAMQPGAGDRP